MGNLATLKPFKPGQSGNPGGRPRGSSIATVLRRKMAEIGEDGRSYAEQAAEVIVREALTGDVKFMQMLVERVDGKVKDRIEVSERTIRVEYADRSIDDPTPQAALGSSEDPTDEEPV